MKNYSLLFVVCAFLSKVFCAGDIPAGFALRQESEHFNVFSQQEDVSIPDIVKRSEDVYQQVTKDLAFMPADKINIFVFPSVDAYHKHFGFAASMPSLIVCGERNDGNVYLVSPTNSGPKHDYQSSISFLGSPITKALMHNISKKQSLPEWFYYGFGLYEAFGGRLIPSYEEKLKLAVSTGQVLTLNQFDYLSNFHGQCAYSLVEFLVQRHGMSAIPALVRDFGNFEKIVGVSQETFYANWLEHVKKQFGVPNNE